MHVEGIGAKEEILLEGTVYSFIELFSKSGYDNLSEFSDLGRAGELMLLADDRINSDIILVWEC